MAASSLKGSILNENTNGVNISFNGSTINSSMLNPEIEKLLNRKVDKLDINTVLNTKSNKADTEMLIG